MPPAPEYVEVHLQVQWATARPIQYTFIAESVTEGRLQYMVFENLIVEALWDSGISVEKINEGIERLVIGPRIWSLDVIPVRREFLAKFHSY